MDPAAGDIAHRGESEAGAVGLGPRRAGPQRTAAVTGGTFARKPGGKVLFTPAAEFAGKAVAGYPVRDRAGRASGVAEPAVTVQPDPAAIVAASFADGVEAGGRAPGPALSGAGRGVRKGGRQGWWTVR